MLKFHGCWFWWIKIFPDYNTITPATGNLFEMVAIQLDILKFREVRLSFFLTIHKFYIFTTYGPAICVAGAATRNIFQRVGVKLNVGQLRHKCFGFFPGQFKTAGLCRAISSSAFLHCIACAIISFVISFLLIDIVGSSSNSYL